MRDVGRLEEAMNQALSASSLPLVMWLCGRLDSAVIPQTLPQHILLCLLQQLGTSDLLDDTVSWLVQRGSKGRWTKGGIWQGYSVIICVCEIITCMTLLWILIILHN